MDPKQIGRWKTYGFCFLALATVYGTLYMFDSQEIERKPLLQIRLQRRAAEKAKQILFWTPWFGDKNWEHIIGKSKESTIRCPHSCMLSTIRGNPLSYDALLFHGSAWPWPPAQRTPNQVYIMYFHESPANGYKDYISGNTFYNWSVTYDRRSDVWSPYDQFRKKNTSSSLHWAPPALPQMSYKRERGEAMVAWLVSNCYTPSRREFYVRLLRRYVKVDVFGGCGRPCTNNSCHADLGKSGKYKFYLAFENSACRDYITEKAFTSLRYGLVPIVYGGLSAREYVKILPPNSFIDVRNFASPRKLAKYLLYLDNNDSVYMGYHAWKRDYEFGPNDGMCAICNALHNSTMTRPRNVNWETFWNPETECDATLIGKVAG